VTYRTDISFPGYGYEEKDLIKHDVVVAVGEKQGRNNLGVSLTFVLYIEWLQQNFGMPKFQGSSSITAYQPVEKINTHNPSSLLSCVEIHPYNQQVMHNARIVYVSL